MSYEPAQVIASLPSDQRVDLQYDGGDTVTAGRASISADYETTLYGADQQYRGSYYVTTDDIDTEPRERKRVTVAGVNYLIIGVKRYPGTLRRLDVGGQYG